MGTLATYLHVQQVHVQNTVSTLMFSVAGPMAWSSPGFYPASNEQHKLFQECTQNVLFMRY